MSDKESLDYYANKIISTLMVLNFPYELISAYKSYGNLVYLMTKRWKN